MALAEDFSWESLPSMAAPSSPAAGAEFTYTVTTAKRGNLIHLVLRLVTSATSASRTVVFQVKRGAYYLYKYPSTGTFANQTAGKTCAYEFGIGSLASDAADQEFRSSPLPDDFELAAGDIISTTTTSIQTGDQWSAVWVYKEVSNA